MSRSPEVLEQEDTLREYVGGWEATLSLLRQGRSWSGFERNCVFLNERSSSAVKPRFVDVSAPSGLDFPDDGRGLVVVDWDHDGDLDLWLSNRTGPRLRLMLNQTRRNGEGASSGSESTAFVDLRLLGRQSNRDAIGARVELEFEDPAPPPLMQTVYAGDGFLSQSSKRLLFGLGSRSDVSVAVVRWPDGHHESFSGIEAGSRYVLEEGRGVAMKEEPRPRVTLTPSASPDPPETTDSTARAVLASPVPLPVLRYATLLQPDEPRHEVEAAEQRPLLLNLWASWCIPCRGELEEWTEREQELRDAGVDVLALTVDGLSSDQTTTPRDARRFVEKIHFPFATGVATTELLEKLELLQQTIFDRHRTSAVPTSFLIDPRQRLATVYRGRVDLQDLFTDVRSLDAPARERQARAAPLGGRWLRLLPEIDARHLARVFRERYPEDTVRFLSLTLDETLEEGRRTSHASAPAEPEPEADAELAGVHFSLAEALQAEGRHDEAAAALREAIRSRPDFPRAHNNLGVALRSEGKVDEAITHFRAALASEPTFAEASYNLGLALAEGSHMEEAVAAFRGAIELGQDYAEAHHALSAVLLRLGQTHSAVQHLEETVRLRPQWPTPLDTLARLLSSHPDSEIRRGGVAVDLAERAANLTRHQHPEVLDTLAMAYAEAGRFEEAVVVGQRALSTATAGGAEDLAAKIRAHLAEYQRGEPFHESGRIDTGQRR